MTHEEHEMITNYSVELLDTTSPHKGWILVCNCHWWLCFDWIVWRFHKIFKVDNLRSKTSVWSIRTCVFSNHTCCIWLPKQKRSVGFGFSNSFFTCFNNIRNNIFIKLKKIQFVLVVIWSVTILLTAKSQYI